MGAAVRKRAELEQLNKITVFIAGKPRAIIAVTNDALAEMQALLFKFDVDFAERRII